MDAANAWLEVADYVVIYMDFGMTEGMVTGLVRAARLTKEIRLRWLEGEKKGTERVLE